MTTETKQELTGDTLEMLQDLIQVNIDARDGFREAADRAGDDSIRALFMKLAEERQHQAIELERYVSMNDKEPRREGSVAAAVHRTWINIRAAFTSNDTVAALTEAERGEEYIKSAYERAIKAHTGNAVNDVLHRQYQRIKTAHDEVQGLRDLFAAEP